MRLLWCSAASASRRRVVGRGSARSCPARPLRGGRASSPCAFQLTRTGATSWLMVVLVGVVAGRMTATWLVAGRWCPGSSAAPEPRTRAGRYSASPFRAAIGWSRLCRSCRVRACLPAADGRWGAPRAAGRRSTQPLRPRRARRWSSCQVPGGVAEGQAQAPGAAGTRPYWRACGGHGARAKWSRHPGCVGTVEFLSLLLPLMDLVDESAEAAQARPTAAALACGPAPAPTNAGSGAIAPRSSRRPASRWGRGRCGEGGRSGTRAHGRTCVEQRLTIWTRLL